MIETLAIDARECDDGVFVVQTPYPIIATIRDGRKYTIGVLRPN